MPNARAPSALVVPDLAGFLAGEWRMARRIWDRFSARSGWLSGIARFAPAGRALEYLEEGILSVGGWSGPARRRYRFNLQTPSVARVEFEDGRPFHHLDLSSGIAFVAHDCPPDRYRGRYVVDGPRQWRLGWIVLGPRKHMIISTRFSRQNEGINA